MPALFYIELPSLAKHRPDFTRMKLLGLDHADIRVPSIAADGRVVECSADEALLCREVAVRPGGGTVRPWEVEVDVDRRDWERRNELHIFVDGVREIRDRGARRRS